MAKSPSNATRVLLDELRRGVTPTHDILRVCVGRDLEKEALLYSIKTVVDGGFSFRAVTGQYGSGKTFLMELMRAVAGGKKARMVTMRAELSPDKLLIGGRTQKEDLWQDLVGSMTAGEEGEPGLGQLQLVLDRLVTRVDEEALGRGRTATVDELLGSVRTLTHGPIAAEVVKVYVRAAHDGDVEVQQRVVTWLSGAYSSTMDSRRALRIGRWEAGLTDRLRIFAALARCAGWNGLFVCVDEMDKMLRLTLKSGGQNLLEVHRMIDLNARRAPGLAIVLSGAPGFVDDTKRGLFSIEPVRQRLSDNEFASQGGPTPLVNFRGPIMRLEPLTIAQSHELLGKLRDTYLSVHPSLSRSRVPDQALEAYLRHCQSFVGAETHLRPRNTIRSFIGLMDILDQNPQAKWQDLLKGVVIKSDVNDDNDGGTSGDDYRL